MEREEDEEMNEGKGKSKETGKKSRGEGKE